MTIAANDALNMGPQATGGGHSTRIREQKKRRMARAREVPPSRHVDSGTFPHWSQTTGLCMCLLSCCMGPSGCKCRPCPCDREGSKGYGLHSGKLQIVGEFSSPVYRRA